MQQQLNNKTMTAFLLTMLLILILFGACLYHISVYESKKKRNDDSAIINRNLAWVCGIFCLIILIALAINNEDFSSNHSNIVIMKENNQATQAFVSISNNGSLVHKGFI